VTSGSSFQFGSLAFANAKGREPRGCDHTDDKDASLRGGQKVVKARMIKNPRPELEPTISAKISVDKP
jgi:hypothetical protein